MDIEAIRKKFEEPLFDSSAATWNGSRYVAGSPSTYATTYAAMKQRDFETFTRGYVAAMSDQPFAAENKELRAAASNMYELLNRSRGSSVDHETAVRLLNRAENALRRKPSQL